MTTKIITLGEIMLRLKAPGVERFFQSPAFEATFGGGEGNVAISLANFGLDVAFVTALPKNPLADACVRFLRGYGVDTRYIWRGGERLGVYFWRAGPTSAPPTSFTTAQIPRLLLFPPTALIGMPFLTARAGSTSPASLRL